MFTMIIRQIRLLRIHLPLLTPYRLSYRTVEAFEPMLIEVCDGNGHSGWGEGHISPGSGNETPEQGWKFCSDAMAVAVGQDVATVKSSLTDALETNPVAASAMISALEMLGGDPLLQPPAEETRLSLLTPVNGLTPKEIEPEIENRLAEGYRTFKIKVGKILNDDIERVRTIQRALAGRATMRIDANRAYSEEDGCRFAAALHPENIELFEQPCAAEDWDANTAVAAVSPVPVMLDEPISSILDIERAASIKGVGLCKLKLKRFGGLSRLKQALDRTRELGMIPVLGDGLGTELNCWMEACVARTTIDNAGEFNGFLKSKTRLFSEPLEFANGYVLLKPGYHPRIDETTLARHTMAEECFGF